MDEEENKSMTTVQFLEMLHDQMETIDRSLTYADVKFVYEGKFVYYRMNMN